jgi:peptide/nickel transport system substrate-binding protein
MLRLIMLACAFVFSATQTLAADAVTLRLAYDSAVGAAASLDPISPNRYWLTNQMVYSRLVRQDERGLPSPDLALSWSASPDAKTWTFKLRPGVKFHDGSDFTAADVVYSLMRIKSDVIKSPVRSVLMIMDKVTARDPLTVEIALGSPHADLPLLLMDYRVRIVSAKYKDGSLDVANESGIGTGPFQLVKFDPQGTTTLKAYPGYWEGKPAVDEVQIFDIADQQARVQAMLSGQVDWLESVDQQQRKLFENNAAFTVLTAETGDWRAMVMRLNLEPFTDIRVRKAFRMAADRAAMMKLLVGADGGTVSCDDPVWAGDPYYSPMSCPQDIAGAKRLLAEAGYPNGIDVDIYSSDLNDLWTKMAEVYQQQAAPAGIRVKIDQVPSDEYNNNYWMKKPLTLTSWGQRPADQILNEAYRSTATWNESAMASKDLDDLLDKARQTTDFAARKAVYGQIQQILFDQGGTFIPFHMNVTSVISSKLKGLPAVQESWIRWQNVSKVD